MEEELADFLYRLSPEAQEAKIREGKRIANLVKNYSLKIESGSWNLNIHWQTDIDLIDLSLPKTKIILENFPGDWEICECDLNKLVSMIRSDFENFYPIRNPLKIRVIGLPKKLWTCLNLLIPVS